MTDEATNDMTDELTGATHDDYDPGSVPGDTEPETAPAPKVENDTSASAEDFFVSRDETGQINPVFEDAKEYGMVKVRPMTYGHVERYFGDAGGIAEAGPGVVAEIMRNHVLDPDFETFARKEYGADYERRGYAHALNAGVVADEMEPLAPMRLLLAVFRASGMDPDVMVNNDGEATVDFEGGEGNPNP